MNAQPRIFEAIKSTVQETDWEAVYWEQMPRVYNFFRYRMGDSALAEDLTGTTFVKAWRNREQYSHDLGAFSTWLFTIARHVAIDHFRRQRDEASLEMMPHLMDEMDVEKAVQERGDFARLRTLLEGLSERERELVALKYGAELTNRAIAELSGLSESNVGTILHRVVHKLRDQWEET
ncbi:MAG: sigma-70 family RNA polymerase sigma factor [Anaerolineae bacterium]|nr:sigma-70 family RNA polymerase sigma factor [Anaerolineae bacterium]